ncbi:hypothetical protein L905_21565 [Agrobacterium sp. TS43]|jgi:hypothetical protein|uniref:hypothetical protein n=1 Tax=Agrobacterium TaxID=357 RepID=UPI00035DE680|nr:MULTISPECIES: hypothetical protein [Agrobacterium]EPR19759.1 hypothetical protein L902_10610 [Agrobacterium radiobacter DSM 30147]KVK45077.1 hypothetical protein L904_26290 [Agrobacterium sp. LY4]KVK45123.1 hypothetical protein L903_26240 [Agrobacterium sp. JL28]KVK58479.1 hypothetical protein L906_26155 [Agrobacterium sp. TS45]KVK61295.1 hypothetical protein L905_21565 [Agrobacterium sp. TS43]
MAFQINAEKSYQVKLARPVKLGAFTYKPLNEITMRGTVVEAIIEQEGDEVLDYAREV